MGGEEDGRKWGGGGVYIARREGCFGDLGAGLRGYNGEFDYSGGCYSHEDYVARRQLVWWGSGKNDEAGLGNPGPN